MSVNEKMTNIANAIREKTGGTEQLTLDDMATEIPKVYDEGKQAQYDLFWDTIQNNGGATRYNSTFYCWTYPWTLFDKLYVPKYDFIHASDANGTFRECYVKDVFKDNYFDYKASTTLLYTFYESTRLENARTLHVSADTKYTYAFNSCINLIEVRFSGTIGQNGLSFKDSTKLSKASIESVVRALSSITSGLTVTFSKTAVNKAFETSNGANDGSTSTEWTTLVATKSNWTIALG